MSGLLDHAQTPVTRLTLRWATGADAEPMRALAELQCGSAPTGPALVAEIDGKLRAALPLDGSTPIVDPSHGGAELVELLRIRAGQLA